MIKTSELVAVFLHEAKDLHSQLEQGLLEYDASGGQVDSDIVDGLFRAAHTIKGSAGVVGLDEIVSFTHLVETALEFIRSGELNFSSDLVSCLLACSDHIGLLLERAEQEKPLEDDSQQQGAQLLQRLSKFMENLLGEQDSVKNSTESCSADQLIVLLRFNSDTFRDGFDPLSLLRFLKTKASVIKEHWFFDEVPAFDQVPKPSDLECCYLSLTLLVADCSALVVDDVFDFVRDSSTYFRFPVETTPEDFQAALGELDEPLQTLVMEVWKQWGVLPEEKDTSEKVDQTKNMTEKSETNTSPTKTVATKDTRLMKVPAFKLDELVNQLGELVIATGALQAQVTDIVSDRLHETIEQIQQLVDDLQGNALHLRMVQIGETFKRFSRVTRDVSLELGKEVRLVIEGGDTELDKSVVESISDPLTHLVRNALDHGLEPPEERVKAGKPSAGTLVLKAYHDSGTVVIEIRDDGRGINRERVRQKAIEKGLITAEQSLSDSDIDMLIFAAGFSTADKVSNLSGRGVGMDVVRRNIESLRGTIHVTSKPGAGCCIQLRLPLSLAIIDGFMVKVRHSHFVIPLDLITECVEFNTDRDEVDGAGFVMIRDELLPYLHLSDFFQLEAKSAEHQSLVVVKSNSSKVGFVVDELLGEFQTVIKSMGAIFNGMQGISGSSILGSGEIALVLDVHKIIELYLKKENRREKRFHGDN